MKLLKSPFLDFFDSLAMYHRFPIRLKLAISPTCRKWVSITDSCHNCIYWRLENVVSRVGRGSFPLSLSQIQTWTSRLIRLLSSSPRINKTPVSKQKRLTTDAPFQPMQRFSLSSFHAFVFSTCPPRYYSVKMVKGSVKRRPMVATIIVYPTLYYWVVHTSKVL